MFTWLSLAAAILGYLLRHWDPAKVHAPIDPLAAALAAAKAQQQQQAIAEALARLQSTSLPPPPGAR